MENVTEELVRQNGNQAAAVMADYAGQGDGGSTGGVSCSDFENTLNFRSATEEDLAKFSKVSSIVRVAEINGVLPVSMVVGVLGDQFTVQHLLGTGYMGQSSSSSQRRAVYLECLPNTSNPTINKVSYFISDDETLLGVPGIG